MALAVREWNIWNTEIFVQSYDALGDVALKTLIWFVVTTFLCIFTLGSMTDNDVIANAWWFITFLILPLFLTFCNHGAKIHKLYGIENDEYHYNQQYMLKNRAKEYLNLPKEDQALYPANILSILKEKDLTLEQKKTIDSEMVETYRAINARNKQRAILSSRNIDIDGVLERLADARRGVKIEIETLKEYS
jgi:hypothetical protein